MDERAFVNNNDLQVLQMKWHPASPTDSHLLVLLSDNTIRYTMTSKKHFQKLICCNYMYYFLSSVYDDTMSTSFSLRHTWRVGSIISNVTKSIVSLPRINNFDDIAVDFEISPPRIVSPNSDKTQVIRFSYFWVPFFTKYFTASK